MKKVRLLRILSHLVPFRRMVIFGLRRQKDTLTSDISAKRGLRVHLTTTNRARKVCPISPRMSHFHRQPPNQSSYRQTTLLHLMSQWDGPSRAVRRSLEQIFYGVFCMELLANALLSTGKSTICHQHHFFAFQLDKQTWRTRVQRPGQPKMAALHVQPSRIITQVGNHNSRISSTYIK